jgi:type III pantothenate kinase
VVAVFDIGNTNLRVALFARRKLLRKQVFASRKRLPLAKIKKIISNDDVDGVVIASVVPTLTKHIVRLCQKHRIEPVLVSTRSKSGLQYRYHTPSTLGADRIAAVVGALALYRKDVIVIDAGTAITIDVAHRGGDFLGGIICPGMHIIASAVQRRTAQLPKIEVVRPRNLVGRSTEECIRSGIFNGTMAMIEGLITRIKTQFKGDFYCVATGGSGKIITKYVHAVDEYNEGLCLHGSLDIYYRNV